MGWTFELSPFVFIKILIFSKHAPEVASTEFNIIYLSQLKRSSTSMMALRITEA